MSARILSFPVAQAEVLQPGTARGRVLKVAALSFWGGVDPATGRLTDPTIAGHGESIAGRVLLIAQPRGSSSSSAVMLELLRTAQAPAAVALGQPDAILGLGIVVAREMGWPTIPLYHLAAEAQSRIADGAEIAISGNGSIHLIADA